MVPHPITSDGERKTEIIYVISFVLLDVYLQSYSGKSSSTSQGERQPSQAYHRQSKEKTGDLSVCVSSFFFLFKGFLVVNGSFLLCFHLTSLSYTSARKMNHVIKAMTVNSLLKG